jgi:hypothetical protein
MDTTWRSNGRWLRLACFLCCLSSGVALLAKVYGLLEMRAFVLGVCLPCTLVLLVVACSSRFHLIASDLAVGAVGGLIGTLAYDIVRIPALMAGYRVYGAISVFGLWLLDAEKSSRFTELAGWSYNYFNGISFGMAYALLMRGRHWIFAVIWAFLLETIAVVSPFGRIFGLRGNAAILAIAFAAHIAYGVPLGRAVQNWRDTRTALAEMPTVARLVLLAIAVVLLFHPLLSPGAVATDERSRAGQFRIEGIALNPSWLRVEQDKTVIMFNPQNQAATVMLKDTGQHWAIPPGGSASSAPLSPGTYQFFVETPGRTRSSFVIVEPVEQSK